MRGKKKNLIKRLHQNNWVSKCPPNPFKLRMSSFWMEGERILFVFLLLVWGLWPVKFSVSLLTSKKHIRRHTLALWQLSSLQFHLCWPFDPPILPAFIFTGLPSWSTPSSPVHYWYQCFLSAALCCGNITLYLPPLPPHPLRCSIGHSPIMQEPWWPGYISPIPSVAGTLASHLLCLLLY